MMEQVVQLGAIGILALMLFIIALTIRPGINALGSSTAAVVALSGKWEERQKTTDDVQEKISNALEANTAALLSLRAEMQSGMKETGQAATLAVVERIEQHDTYTRNAIVRIESGISELALAIKRLEEMFNKLAPPLPTEPPTGGTT